METLTKSAPNYDSLSSGPESLKDHDLFKQLEAIKKGVFDEQDPFESLSGPWFEQEMNSVSQAVEELTEQTLVKISQRLGSNEGGWYQNQETDERFYLKFYQDPDQARVEFIANEVYRQLGIKAAKSELVEVDGQLAMASAEVPDSKAAYCQDQVASPDVQSGFVADAYLANWDVVGLNYDNIVASPDGFHRIDNSGSIIFRAQGELKDFSADNIPELETMLNPEFTAGRVFAGLTETEIATQARQLVNHLNPESIEQIVSQSGIAGQAAETIRNGLLGRRQFLLDQLEANRPEVDHPQGNSRLGRVLDQFDSREKASLKQPETRVFRNCEAILGDEDHIENQSISLIDARDRGCLEVRFKLTATHYAQVQNQLKQAQESGEPIESGHLEYYSANDDKSVYMAAEAFELEHLGLTIRIARETPEEEVKNPKDWPRNRSFLGEVNIDIPYQDEASDQVDKIETQINDVLVNLLNIPTGLTEPNLEAEQKYKRARYAWHHNTQPNLLTAEQIEEAQSMARREVFPGYSTIVHEGMHRYYEQNYGQFAPFHQLSNSDSILSILNAGGLMSSHDRLSRGQQDINGKSTDKDRHNGSSVNVFTRTIVDSPHQETFPEKTIHSNEYFIIMDPRVYDRTDWYAYPVDYYGSTEDKYFNYRQAPIELLQNQLDEGFLPNEANEQMFRAGISCEDFRALACQDELEDRRRLTQALVQRLLPDEKKQQQLWSRGPEAVQGFIDNKCDLEDTVNNLWASGPQAIREFLSLYDIDEIATEYGQEVIDVWFWNNPRMYLIDQLQRAGIKQINGCPVEQFVVEAQNQYDFIDIANGQPPRSQAKTKLLAYKKPRP